MSSGPTWRIQYGNTTLEGYADTEKVVVTKKPNAKFEVLRDLLDEEEPKGTQEDTLEVSEEEIKMTADYLLEEVDWEDEQLESYDGTPYTVKVDRNGGQELCGRTRRIPLGGEIWESAAEDVRSFYMGEANI